MAEQLDWLINDTDTVADDAKTDPPQPQPAEPRSLNRLTMLLVIAATVFVTLAVQNGRLLPDDRKNDDRVVIDADGRYAMVLYDDDRPNAMTDGQKAAFNWSGILAFCKDRGIQYRRFDAKNVDEESERNLVEEHFRQMIEKAAPPPSLTIAIDGKLTTEPLPDGIERFRNAIESK